MDRINVRADAAHGSTIPAATWSQVPHLAVDAVASGKLIPTDLVILSVLLRFARASHSCWPSVPTIARSIGRERRAVQLRLRVLESEGWIASKPADNPTGREIILLWRVHEPKPQEGAQPTTHPPRKLSGRPPAPRVAPEWKKHPEKKQPASPSCPLGTGTTTPADETGDDPPPSTQDVRAFFATLRQRPPIRPAGRFSGPTTTPGTPGPTNLPKSLGEVMSAMRKTFPMDPPSQ